MCTKQIEYNFSPLKRCCTFQATQAKSRESEMNCLAQSMVRYISKMIFICSWISGSHNRPPPPQYRRSDYISVSGPRDFDESRHIMTLDRRRMGGSSQNGQRIRSYHPGLVISLITIICAIDWFLNKASVVKYSYDDCGESPWLIFKIKIIWKVIVRL